jgi:hypothetical protein
MRAVPALKLNLAFEAVDAGAGGRQLADLGQDVVAAGRMLRRANDPEACVLERLDVRPGEDLGELRDTRGRRAGASGDGPSASASGSRATLRRASEGQVFQLPVRTLQTAAPASGSGSARRP